MQVDANEMSIVARDKGFSQAESIIQVSQKLQHDLHSLGHDWKFHFSNTLKIENEDGSCLTSEEETNEQILRHEKSAAGILCQLKNRRETQASHLPLAKDVVGIVATLGKVEDDDVSRIFSEYLGMETMLAIVCRTYEGVKALEMYDNEGCINKSSGLHGLGASIGRSLDGRFLVICLESMRPYAGKFLADDPQRRLNILKPRLPNGECPAGFLGFAVNMINVDCENLFCLTPSGYGLRETLFYNLFSRLQVYKTRVDMIQALPCISDGALSLDGGIIRSNGVFSTGSREDVDVRFPKASERSRQPEHYIETEMQIKEMRWKKDKIVDDLKREQGLLNGAKFDFDRKKNEFLKFLTESSSYASQCQVQTAQDQFMSR
ncbi:protein DEFECTIVE IN MERISTEM SILENCING 3 [Quillaja saponaria]|uniref:Protein DEFECTIVE IN MERISTEM SILENCING 3 n=1 Tax=Quillaja saponaria TaxID=32244 RepID=A0AAD7PSK4_QUISA|nr:protein DEFECTIVE IN MERISTEM SILENCING 3 [Quillaja saponaria]